MSRFASRQAPPRGGQGDVEISASEALWSRKDGIPVR